MKNNIFHNVVFIIKCLTATIFTLITMITVVHANKCPDENSANKTISYNVTDKKSGREIQSLLMQRLPIKERKVIYLVDAPTLQSEIQTIDGLFEIEVAMRDKKSKERRVLSNSTYDVKLENLLKKVSEKPLIIEQLSKGIFPQKRQVSIKLLSAGDIELPIKKDDVTIATCKYKIQTIEFSYQNALKQKVIYDYAPELQSFLKQKHSSIRFNIQSLKENNIKAAETLVREIRVTAISSIE